MPLAELYPAPVLDALAGSVDTFRRWGITQGQGALVGATLGELPVPQAIAAMTSGARSRRHRRRPKQAELQDAAMTSCSESALR